MNLCGNNHDVSGYKLFSLLLPILLGQVTIISTLAIWVDTKLFHQLPILPSLFDRERILLRLFPLGHVINIIFHGLIILTISIHITIVIISIIQTLPLAFLPSLTLKPFLPCIRLGLLRDAKRINPRNKSPFGVGAQSTCLAPFEESIGCRFLVFDSEFGSACFGLGAFFFVLEKEFCIRWHVGILASTSTLFSHYFHNVDKFTTFFNGYPPQTEMSRYPHHSDIPHP
mmetsp:Transcript_18406/g.39808  ORF Transcript_18406/g.39808 Transcript_18406/m.39808 type:complete len:228 (-) Transcript_18406:776-1459(-)